MPYRSCSCHWHSQTSQAADALARAHARHRQVCERAARQQRPRAHEVARPTAGAPRPPRLPARAAVERTRRLARARANVAGCTSGSVRHGAAHGEASKGVGADKSRIRHGVACVGAHGAAQMCRWCCLSWPPRALGPGHQGAQHTRRLMGAREAGWRAARTIRAASSMALVAREAWLPLDALLARLPRLPLDSMLSRCCCRPPLLLSRPAAESLAEPARHWPPKPCALPAAEACDGPAACE
jgi:hypothetical protein